MFKRCDKVKVEYRFGEFYQGEVLWTEVYDGLYWVTVRPDDPKYISTFGSYKDMGNGYKTYMADKRVNCRVFSI